jgi:dTMP kinase
MRGVLITLEGVEGSGKSTQCQLLAERLRARSRDVVTTREPDGTGLGVAIRALFDRPGPPPTVLTQALLFMAARQQHVSEVIRPALGRGAVVLSDRYVDATLAYQGYGLGLDLETIRDLNALATGGLAPDLTVLLDLAPEAGMRRIASRRLDAFERMDLDFHRRVREGYLEIARTDKPRVAVVGADQPVDVVHGMVAAAVDEFLRGRGSERAG